MSIVKKQNWRQNNFHFGSHCHFSDDNWKYYWWINQWSGMVTIVVGHISASFGVKDVTWTYSILGFALVTIAQVGYQLSGNVCNVIPWNQRG